MGQSYAFKIINDPISTGKSGGQLVEYQKW